MKKRRASPGEYVAGFDSDAYPMSFLRMPPPGLTREEQAAWNGFVAPHQELLQQALASPPAEHEHRLAQVMALTDLEHAVRDYRRSNNPVELLRAFTLYVRAGYFPCPDHLRLIADVFEAYLRQPAGPLDSIKPASLDQLLGLPARQGGNSAANDFAIHQRDLALMSMFTDLVALGATADQAAEMIHRRLQTQKNWNTSGWKIAGDDGIALSAKTIKNYYERIPVYARNFRVTLFERFHNELLSPLESADRIARFLADFPRPRDAAPTFMPLERRRAIKKHPTPSPFEIGGLKGF